MSIIYDALQKAQKTRMGENENPQKKRVLATPTYIIIINILLIISLLAFSKIYSSIWGNKGKSPPVQARIKTEKVKAAIKDKLILSGMFISKEDKFVVINDKTLHEGDQLDGSKIEHIDPSKVILSKKGRFFSLKGDLGPS